MDLTTLAAVKAEARIKTTTDDTLISTLVVRVSDAIAKYCAKSVEATSDYFSSGPVVDEVLRARLDVDGNIICWPHKSRVSVVSKFEYRLSPVDSWTEIDLDRVVVPRPAEVLAVQISLARSKQTQARISYTGGSGSSASNLPSDLVEAATVLTVRYYRESEGGLNDAIGIAELGSLIYTKSMPIRVVQTLAPYVRPVAW